ncbi:MAG: hypothetical protein K2N46_09740, partial [Lachnospiraceae bacterium]|nr:hypothetical protein [Lachnospiraceae bacterium]
MKNMNEEIMRNLQESVRSSSLSLTSKIQFLEVSEENLRMLLPADAVSDNMQNDDAAFEGWAVIIYTYFMKAGKRYKHMVLDIEEFLYDEEVFRSSRNCNRFLYRVLRFSEQYASWFLLSERLRKAVELFVTFLKERPVLTNNTPGQEAVVPANRDSEAAAEMLLAADDGAKLHEIFKNSPISIGGNPINRQLPVGLFAGEVKDKNAVFPRRKAAIDMWTWNEDTFYIVELKKENKKVGILSEIFFYANYMRDLLLADGRFTFHEKGKAKRGYESLKELVEKEAVKRIGAIMLT